MKDYLAHSDEADLSQTFKRFASRETAAIPLYYELSRSIADDEEMLALASRATSKPVPNLLLSAVHYIALQNPDLPLAHYFPDIADPVAGGDPFPIFKDFCREYRLQIIDLLETKRVQTNEVRRSAFLWPAFNLIQERLGDLPLALVEFGCSAGLNLLWDQYGYDYGNGQLYGRQSSPVQIHCELRGELRPPLSERVSKIVSRIGIDLNPINIQNQEEVDWLRALIWPGDQKRVVLLENALKVARLEQLDLRRGDVIEVLPQVLEELPEDLPVCVLNSFTFNQLSPEARERFQEMIESFGKKRRLFNLMIAGSGQQYPEMTLEEFEDGGQRHFQVLAQCAPHGQWLTWISEKGR